MKRYKLILFFNIFILLTASAQKIENLVELKQQSENRLFHRLDKAPRTPPLHPKVIGYGAAQ